MAKVIPVSKPLSPEKYIVTKARSLPIYECKINKEWEESGLAHIVISRLHPQGNITAGIFLVDLKCLGLKDSFYFFNRLPGEYREMIEKMEDQYELVDVDYHLVHNIIYEGISYAEEFEIDPCKEFKITKYLLEEDNDDIPLIDITCGHEGKPMLIITEAMPQYRKYIGHLRNKVGEDNFYYSYTDSYGNVLESNLEGHNAYFEDNEDEEEEDDFEDDEEDLLDKYIEMYEEMVGELPDTETDGFVPQILKVSFDAMNINGLNEAQLKLHQELLKASVKNEPGLETRLRNAITQHPDVPVFYNLLAGFLYNQKREPEALALSEENIFRFPQYTMGKIQLAQIAAFRNEYEKIPELLSNFNFDLLFEGRDTVHASEVLALSRVGLSYFLWAEDIPQAWRCFDALYEYGATDETIKSAELEFMLKMNEYLSRRLKVTEEGRG